MSKVIFLDRDGTINVDYGYVSDIDRLEFMPDVFTSLRRIEEAGYKLIIVTNQSGIGRGYFSYEKYNAFTDYLLEQFKQHGIHITHIYMCPHISEDHCHCRKPETGMFEQAGREYNINWEESYAIGDKERDLSICEKVPVTGIYFTQDLDVHSKYVVKRNWKEITDYILKESV